MKQVASSELNDFPASYFYRAVSIYLRKAFVVNRKLSGVVNVACLGLNPTKWNKTVEETLIKKLRESQADNLASEVKNLLTTLGVSFVSRDHNDLDKIEGSEQEVFLCVDRMLPRNVTKFKAVHQLTLIDAITCSATFQTLEDSCNLVPSVPYTISYHANQLTLQVPENSTEESTNWLNFVLFKKIQIWMEGCATDELRLFSGSHELIDSECYNETYARLKDKYGPLLEAKLTEFESTDPKKFVYEDISIASYLVVLWKQERRNSGSEELQSFVDLGCGNGLLVYILSQEGHRGYGIDLRKRRIWEQFKPETDLREEAIVPSDETLFPDVDWLIGNHSDELSPWIPVISARSSIKSKYFLIPCCAFEFSGQKFQRKGNKSQYLSFIDYLKTVSDACGFEDTKIDRLKIPSTKRICLIGSARSIDESQFKNQCGKIQEFINGSSSQGSAEKWSEAFKPRNSVEAVRNCSRIDKFLTEKIVKRIFDCLTTKKAFSEAYPGWNCGGRISIPDAVKLVAPEDLKRLKAECGGMQTLLRNKHQIFEVHGGEVKIRLPKKLSEKLSSGRIPNQSFIKTSPCFFFKNHEQSCPLEEADCSYIHESE